MAGQIRNFVVTYRIEDSDGIPMYTGVTYGTEAGYVKKPTADNAVPVGIVCTDERIANSIFSAGGDQKGRNIAVLVEGYGKIKISGNVSYGDALILGAGGVAKKCPTAPGKYNILGFAEANGVDGDVIPVRICVFEKTI